MKDACPKCEEEHYAENNEESEHLGTNLRTPSTIESAEAAPRLPPTHLSLWGTSIWACMKSLVVVTRSPSGGHANLMNQPGKHFQTRSVSEAPDPGNIATMTGSIRPRGSISQSVSQPLTSPSVVLEIPRTRLEDRWTTLEGLSLSTPLGRCRSIRAHATTTNGPIRRHSLQRDAQGQPSFQTGTETPLAEHRSADGTAAVSTNSISTPCDSKRNCGRIHTVRVAGSRKGA